MIWWLCKCCWYCYYYFNFRHYFWRSDYGVPQSKPVFKKENGTPAYGSSSTSYASSVMDNNVNRQPPSWRYLSFSSYLYKNNCTWLEWLKTKFLWFMMCLQLSSRCYKVKLNLAIFYGLKIQSQKQVGCQSILFLKT